MVDSPPNIVWITLDSVRADHTSMHGYRRDTTPELGGLAAESEGLAFEHCIAHSTRTPVSVPSMLTGTYPSHHRIGLGAGSPGTVPPSMATAPELLGDQGYYTAAVSRNAYAGEVTGLDRGFDTFVRPTLADDLRSYPHVASLLKYGLNARRHSGGLTRDKQRHPKSYLVTDAARRVVSRAPDDDPFFLYVHYNDPHRPYYPPRSYRERFTDEVGVDPGEAMAFAADMHENAYRHMADGIPYTDEQWDMLYAMYDATIAYVDSCVGSLVESVRQRHENTVFVITADHGELFGERGLLGHHIVLHDAVIHVPLVVWGLPALGDRTDEPVQHVDVMQTLVSMAGGDVSQFHGFDLRSERREYAISQDLRGTVDDDEERNYERILQYNPEFDTSQYHESLVTALRTTDHKLVHTEEWDRLYRLPDEETDVRGDDTAVAEELSTAARDWLEVAGQPFEEAPDDSRHSARLERHLREMGYVE